MCVPRPNTYKTRGLTSKYLKLDLPNFLFLSYTMAFMPWGYKWRQYLKIEEQTIMWANLCTEVIYLKSNYASST